MTNQPATPSIWTKVAQITVEIGAVGKDSQQTHHKFDYRSGAALVDVAHAHFARHGLVLVPNVTTKGDSTDRRIWQIDLRLVDTDDLSEIATTIHVPDPNGQPTGVGAAITYATKYFLGTLFTVPFTQIELEEQPDPVPDQEIASILERVKALPEEQKSVIREAANQAQQRGECWSFGSRPWPWTQDEFRAFAALVAKSERSAATPAS